LRTPARQRLAAQTKALFLRGVPISLPHEAFDAAHAFASAIHDQIAAGDLVGGLRHFIDRGDAAWQWLVEAFPACTARERATLLAEVWTTTRRPVPNAIALPLFRRAVSLRETVPSDLPEPLVLFRGVAAGTEEDARSALVALSWTSGRAAAERYAHSHLDWRVRAGHPAGEPWVGRIHVTRADVLAWFTHRGDDEAVLDPARLGPLTIEPVLD
jgi:hypothetical protein